MPASQAQPHQAAITAEPPNPNHVRRWRVLAVLAVAQLMVALDTTVVNIALPTAQRSLGFSDSDRQWIITGYALAFGSLLLVGGRLADLVGRRRLFLIGLAGFAAASAVGGAANSFAMLVMARAVQGVFAAFLAPAGLAVLTTTFTEVRERARAFGVYGAVGAGGGAVGLLLGGLLTEYASWRWTLFINLAFAAAAIAGGLLWVRQADTRERPEIDWPGTVTVSAGLFALVYGFSRAETASWGDALTIALLACAGTLLAAFTLLQTRAAHPLLPLRVVLDRNRGSALLAMFAAAIGMFGVFLFLTYYLQLSQGYSAVRTGVAFLPMVAGLILASTVAAAALVPRVTPRILIPAGMLLSAAGLWVLTGLGQQGSYLEHTLPGTVIFGAGIGVVFASAVNLATAGVHPDDAGVASALVNTTQQVGGSVGTALLNTLAATAATAFAAGHRALPDVAALAAVHSYTVAYWWAAGFFVAGGIAVAFLLRSGLPREQAARP